MPFIILIIIIVNKNQAIIEKKNKMKNE